MIVPDYSRRLTLRVAVLALGVACLGPALVARAATSASPAITPLREVVYHVSYQRNVGGSVTAISSDHGSVTVDVMAVRNNALGVKVAERWTRNPATIVALGTIEPNGRLDFAPGALSDATLQLLPYFAPKFAPQDLTSVGIAWTVSEHRPPLDAKTRYSVANIQGTAVTIKISQSITVSDATQARISGSGAVVYEPRLLVPLSGDITRRLTALVGGSSKTIVLRLHFARASDTREP